jgi:hypothetical protein
MPSSPLRVALALALACGPPAAPPPVVANRGTDRALDLAVKLERTQCFGMCPSYTVTIHGDGKVTWHGDKYVATVGDAIGRTDPAQLEQLVRAIDQARFFERDESGKLDRCRPGLRCVIVTCSDTPHSVLDIHRGAQHHTVDNAHCTSDNALDNLETLIDQIANTRVWIGEPRF